MTTNQLAYMANMETIRANRARELETQRSNLAQEGETHRSNRVREQETHRSNVAQESETHRANVAREQFNIADAARKNELTAQNILNNYILGSRQARTAEINATVNSFNALTGRYDADTRRISAQTGQSSQQETVRHNLTMEQIDKARTLLNAYTSAFGSVLGLFPRVKTSFAAGGGTK